MTPAPLASYAMDVQRSRGRRFPEPQHPYRDDYARDRDRVIHSRAFRRLEAKTQVFTTRYSDHFRNRLTHTIEVAQIARTVSALCSSTPASPKRSLSCTTSAIRPSATQAKSSSISECASKAIALTIISMRFASSNNSSSAISIFPDSISLSKCAKASSSIRGIIPPRNFRRSLNIFWTSGHRWKHSSSISWTRLLTTPPTSTTRSRRACCDLDLLRAEVPIFNEAYAEIDQPLSSRAAAKLKFNEALKQILNRLATDLIDNTSRQVLESGVESVEDVRRLPNRLAAFSPEIARQNAELKRFLHARLYSNAAIAEDRDRSVASLDALFLFFVEHPGPHAKTVCRAGPKRAAPSSGLRLHRRHDRPFSLAPTQRTPGCPGGPLAIARATGVDVSLTQSKKVIVHLVSASIFSKSLP